MLSRDSRSCVGERNNPRLSLSHRKLSLFLQGTSWPTRKWSLKLGVTFALPFPEGWFVLKSKQTKREKGAWRESAYRVQVEIKITEN